MMLNFHKLEDKRLKDILDKASLIFDIPSCEFSDRENKRLIHQSVTFKYPFLETKIIEQTTCHVLNYLFFELSRFLIIELRKGFCRFQ